jgi:RNA polymerase sigma-70 factor (ECF subfamily)
MSDADVIDRAKLGDIHCFEQLYGLHKRRVYSLCLRMVGDVQLAEDLSQEAFLLLFRKVASFRGDSAFSTWLHRLTVNVVLMHARKKGLPLVSLDETLDLADDEAPRKEIASHDTRLIGSIDRVILDRAITNLPPGYRIIFVLHDVEGYEHKEIAGMLGCSVGNSKSQLHKARTKLRGILNVTRAENLRHKAPRKLRTQPEVNVHSTIAAAAAA